MSTQNAVNLLQSQYKQMQDWLLGAMDGVTDEVAHYQPGGLATPIAAQIVHLVTGLDFFLLGFGADKAPLLASSFADKSGISEPPPEGGDWHEWGNWVKVDLEAFHQYATAVFDEVDTYLASLSDADLEVTKTFGQAGEQTVAWALGIMLLNTYSHTGEIAVIKGLQGLKGYAF